MRLNTRPAAAARTHEGAPAVPPATALAELRRAVSSCMLWENQFYEDGVAIADRIAGLVAKCDPADVAFLAATARQDLKLRHAPLWLLVALANSGQTANAAVYEAVIDRADEMGELIAMFWKDGKRPLPAQMKVGIARAFAKFDAYQLAKYDRKVSVKLRDVIRLVHPRPANDDQSAVWKALIAGDLPSPDTWEVALSAGADKQETFTRLLREGKLGYLALLRNLRNMAEAGVDHGLVRDAIIARKGAHKVLPFRFVAAARAAPQFEPALDEALCASIEHLPVLPGRTVVAVDISGSMRSKLSEKSELTRIDAAAALGCLIHGDVRMIVFADGAREVAPRRGLAGVDLIRGKIGVDGYGTNIRAAVALADKIGYDRLILVTDEQSATPVGAPKGRGYVINVASYQNGIGYGPWTRINGFSESVLRYIAATEGIGDC